MASRKRKTKCQRLVTRAQVHEQRSLDLKKAYGERGCRREPKAFGCQALLDEAWKLDRSAWKARDLAEAMNCGHLRHERGGFQKKITSLRRKGLLGLGDFPKLARRQRTDLIDGVDGLKKRLNAIRDYLLQGECAFAGMSLASFDQAMRDVVRPPMQACEKAQGITGLAACIDERGFVPVPSCMGYSVPKLTRKECPHGVNRNTGQCLKHPRKKGRR